jgi:hypothetical protein
VHGARLLAQSTKYKAVVQGNRRMNNEEPIPLYKDQCRNDQVSSSEPTRVVATGNRMSNNQEPLPRYKDQCRDDDTPSSGLPRVMGVSAPNGATDARASNNESSVRTSSDPSTSEIQVTVQDGHFGGKRSVHDSNRARDENEAVPVPIAFPVDEAPYMISTATGSAESTVPPESNHRTILLVGTALICLLIIGVVAVSTVCALGRCTSGNGTVRNNPAPLMVQTSKPAVAPSIVPTPKPAVAPSTVMKREPLPIGSAGVNVESAALIAERVNALTLSQTSIVYPSALALPTPEELALAWLVETDPIVWDSSTLPDFQFQQRYALLTTFYAAYASAENITSFPWNLDIDECSWGGIECDSNGQVDRLDWYGRKLSGQLPADVGLLTGLVYFSTSDNEFSGSLPETIGRWTDVSVFSVFNNKLTGTIPDGIAEWTEITEAYFYGNDLTGTMPVGICRYVDQVNDRLLVDCPTSSESVACSCCTTCV